MELAHFFLSSLHAYIHRRNVPQTDSRSFCREKVPKERLVSHWVSNDVSIHLKCSSYFCGRFDSVLKILSQEVFYRSFTYSCNKIENILIGGCNGLSYTLNYAFEEPKDNGSSITAHGIKVFIEPMALFNVIGTTMDWEEDELTSEFTFNNPNSKGECGCGESFTV